MSDEIKKAEDRQAANDKILFPMLFDRIQALAHANSVNKGFWETPDTIDTDGSKINLMHAELSEATEGLRAGNPPDDKIPEFSSAEAEFADCVIRIMDLAQRRGWRIGDAIIAKMTFNATRPHKHGKLY